MSWTKYQPIKLRLSQGRRTWIYEIKVRWKEKGTAKAVPVRKRK